MPSTVIRSFHYDATQEALVIVFQSGNRYRYQGVPEETFRAMQAALSKGEFFNTHIRDRYPFVRE